MHQKKYLFVWLCLAVALTGLAQKPKVYFDKSGKYCSESVAYYYRQETDTTNFFRSYFMLNGKLAFAGSIKTASPDDESKNLYSGKCTWYHKNGNLRMIKNFTDNGEETGTSKYYYESGKIWKEIEYNKGKQASNTYVEYNEDGAKNKIFEEEFANNNNEWDFYTSDKSSASIAYGLMDIVSTSKEGTSRYINHPIESDEYTIEAAIDISLLKDNDKVGIIYGFKDWQNYNYFAISKKNIYVGAVYEGVKSTVVDALYSSAITPMQMNVIKILCNGEKVYYSVNGEIQLKDDNHHLFGNNHGFVLGGNAHMKVERFIIKEMNISGSGSSISTSPDDEGIKATGSGVIFSTNGYILTNHHVVENSSKFVVDITNADGTKKSYKAELITQDKDNDLAILKIKDDKFSNLTEIKYAFKESGQLDVGAGVFTIGYPHALTGMGKDAKFTDGKISSKTGYNGNINSFQTTIPVQPGNSGGPVFNDAGYLIGVINATFHDADNVSYAIKLNYIKNLIELLSDKVDLPNNTSLTTLSLEEKIKVLTNYVVLIKVK